MGAGSTPNGKATPRERLDFKTTPNGVRGHAVLRNQTLGFLVQLPIAKPEVAHEHHWIVAHETKMKWDQKKKSPQLLAS